MDEFLSQLHHQQIMNRQEGNMAMLKTKDDYNSRQI